MHSLFFRFGRRRSIGECTALGLMTASNTTSGASIALGPTDGNAVLAWPLWNVTA